MEVEVESQRHPFRFLFKFLVFVGVLYFAGKLVAQQKEKWQGLTESEARSRIEAMASKVDEDKAKDIADQIVAVLLERGVLKEDTVVVEDIDEVVDEVVAEAEEAAAEIAEDE